MNAKVIAVTFETRATRVPSQGALFHPDHYQNISNLQDGLRQLRDVVQWEKEQNPGAPYDLIIVRSGQPYNEGDEYLKSLEGTKTPWGTIHVLFRDNTGWSFGAFSDAYSAFKGKYNYWIFTEDDILVGGDGYYRNLIDKFNRTPYCGYVGLVNISRHSYGIHCSGGIGLTHDKILSQLYERNQGKLPHNSEPEEHASDLTQRKRLVITRGEVPFTNEILMMGYDLVTYGNGTEWNLKKNLCIPYYHYKHEIH